MHKQKRDGCTPTGLLARLAPLTFTIAAAFCSTSMLRAADTKNYLHTAIPVDPGTADVQKTTEFYCIPLNIYDRLVETITVKPGESKIIPSLAEKWEVSPNGLVYTFHLRKGVKFQNGETFKADDVYFTFDRMLDPKTQALNTDFLNMIAGAEDRVNGKASTVSGLKVLDDSTIRITLAAPFAPFIANLGTPPCSIYNRKATVAAGDKFGVDPAKTVGTGPFVFESWVTNDVCRLKANPNYFRGKPTLAGIDMLVVPDVNTQRMQFETGKLDLLDLENAVSQVPYFLGSNKWKKQIVSGPIVGIYFYALNEKIKPLNDVRVRKAIQYAIDRKLILDKIYNGQGVVEHGILPRGLIGHNPSLPTIPYDPKKAKQLLAEAGCANGFDLEIAQTNDNPRTLKVNEVVQSMLAQVGIRVKILQLDSASYYALRKDGKMQAYETYWSADYNDPDNFIYTFFSEDNSTTRAFNYINKKVFAKLEEARQMVDQNKRIKLYQELEKTIAQDDAAWVPLFSTNQLFVVRPRVKNFKVSWNGWSDMSYNGISVE